MPDPTSTTHHTPHAMSAGPPRPPKPLRDELRRKGDLYPGCEGDAGGEPSEFKRRAFAARCFTRAAGDPPCPPCVRAEAARPSVGWIGRKGAKPPLREPPRLSRPTESAAGEPTVFGREPPPASAAEMDVSRPVLPLERIGRDLATAVSARLAGRLPRLRPTGDGEREGRSEESVTRGGLSRRGRSPALEEGRSMGVGARPSSALKRPEKERRSSIRDGTYGLRTVGGSE